MGYMSKGSNGVYDGAYYKCNLYTLNNISISSMFRYSDISSFVCIQPVNHTRSQTGTLY